MKSSSFLLLVIVSLIPFGVFAQSAVPPSSGSGTEASPYEISSIYNLYWLSQNSVYWDKYYIQTADIDLSSSSGWASGSGFQPIGNNVNEFTGGFDGNGFTISNMTINRPNSNIVGLFGYTNGATLTDIALTNATVSGYFHVGVLVGYGLSSTISECSTSGTLVAGENAGGLIGYSSSDITDSNSSVAVTGKSGYSHSMFGGLVGYISRASITNSYATGSVTGTTDVGGLVGHQRIEVDITKSYATGAVSGTTNVGGLVGRSGDGNTVYATRTMESYATGNVTGQENVGGLIGSILNARVFDSYAMGNVTGTGTASKIGALVGLADNDNIREATKTQIFRNYTTGTASGSTNVGAVIGSVTISNSDYGDNYWNNETGGPNNSIGTGITTAEMRTQSTYSNFNFSSVWLLAGDAYFPELRNNQKSSYSGFIFTNGSGTSADPYQISTIEQLHAVRAFPTNHFILMNDLDLTSATGTSGGKYWNGGAGFAPIGLTTGFFMGTFNGNHKTITGLHINNSDYYTGLFASLAGGWIADLTLEDVDITGSGNEVGALAGNINSGSVYRVKVTGDIEGNSVSYTGGIAGRISGTTSSGGKIVDSYANVDITGNSTSTGGIVGSISSGLRVSNSHWTGTITTTLGSAGGIVGSNSGSVQNSYTTGAISTAYAGGGLVGVNNGSISGSYTTGTGTGSTLSGGLVGSNNGTISNSYWNTETSGNTLGVASGSSSGVTGLTSAQMRDSDSFVGFDFNSRWDILENMTFPWLRSPVPRDDYPGVNGRPDGSGTDADPYLIANFDNMYWLSQDSSMWSGVFEQTADIDLASIKNINASNGFSPIGNSERNFSGKYDGQGYKISNLFINRASDAVGLFGHVTGGTLRNIVLRDVDVSGHTQVGALAGGVSSGTVSGVSVTGKVNGTANVAGLMGYLTQSSTLSKCYFVGEVHNTGYRTGGLVGQTLNTSTISDSYAIADLQGTVHVGGLVGAHYSNSVMSNSFASGSITGTAGTGGVVGALYFGSLMNNVYWDSEATATTKDIGEDGSSTATATGLTSAQMITSSSFANWDFTNTWGITEGSSYPYLKSDSYRYSSFEITGGEGWRMLGAPVEDAKFASLKSSIWTQGFAGANTTSGSASVYTWSETAQNWVSPDSLQDTLTTGKGFIIYVYEDDDYETEGIQGGFPKRVSAAGFGNSLPQTLTLNYSNGSNSALDGYNLMANPSASVIDWEQVDRTNVNATYQVWDAANSHYDYYQAGVGGGNGGTQYIAPFQGFWVQANAASASIIIDSTGVSSEERAAYKETPVYSILLNVKNEEGFSDELRLVANNNATDQLDTFDAMKLSPLSGRYVSFSSVSDGDFFSIDSRPIQGEMRFPIQLNALGTSKEAKISLSENKLPEDWTAELVHVLTGERFNLLQDSVDVVLNELKAKTKKGVSLSPVQTITNYSDWEVVLGGAVINSSEEELQLPKAFGLDQNYPNPFNPSTVISYQLPENAIVDLRVFDMLGREVATLVSGQVKAGHHQVSFNATNLASGMYIYRLQTGSLVFNKKLTLIK